MTLAREIRRGFEAAVWSAVTAGTVIGIGRGWKYVGVGIPRGLAAEIADGMVVVLAFVLGFFAILAPVRRALMRWLPRPRIVHGAASAIACIPAFVAAGYQVNLRAELAPSTVLTRRGLEVNAWLALSLLGVLALVTLVSWWLTRRWESQPPAPGRRAPWTLAAGLIAVVNIAAVPGWSSGLSSHPQVFLIVLDCLRADHVGAYGYGRPTTPNLDALARDGTTFLNAISQGTFTKTSIASLLTGRQPWQHGVYRAIRRGEDGTLRADALPETELTIAERLAAERFVTVAWVRNTNLRPVWGFDQGFLAYDPHRRTAGSVNAAFRRWYERIGRGYPLFVYLHYLDLHDPYRPDAPFDGLFGVHSARYASSSRDRWERHVAGARNRGGPGLPDEDIEQLRALYDGQLRALDEEVGELVAWLRETGTYDQSLIVVTSDHGEAFGEHGFLTHSNLPYDELIRVPLVVKFPGGAHRGRVVETQVRHVDVVPTILESVAQPASDLPGCSLLALLDERTLSAREKDCFSLAVSEHLDAGKPYSVSVRTPAAKYLWIDGRQHEYYDLATDPEETQNRIAEAGVLKDTLSEIAAAVAAGRREAVDQPLIDAQTLERLKSLGYVQ